MRAFSFVAVELAEVEPHARGPVVGAPAAVFEAGAVEGGAARCGGGPYLQL